MLIALLVLTLCNTSFLVFLVSRATKEDFQKEDDIVLNATEDVRNSQASIKTAISKLPKGGEK